MNQLNWYWIGVELAVPSGLALLAAVPFWRKEQMILGNIAGTALLFGCAFGLIWREYVVIDRITQACLDAGTTCWPEPSAFTRFAIYGFIGLFEVFGLFSLSLYIEHRMRRRDYAPEWR